MFNRQAWLCAKRENEIPEEPYPFPFGSMQSPFKQHTAAIDPQGLLLKFHTPSVRLDFTSCMWSLKMSMVEKKGVDDWSISP